VSSVDAYTGAELNDQASSLDARIAILLDPGSTLEVAAQARSQQASIAAETPRDGVSTVLGKIHGRNVAVLAEESDILNRTDGEVARTKRHRLFDLARMTGIPVVVMFDGPTTTPPRFDPNSGELAGHQSDPRLDINVRDRAAPLIGVICGQIVGWARSVVGECDVLIAPKSSVDSLRPDTPVDIVTADIGSAIEMAASIVDLLAPLSEPKGVSPAAAPQADWTREDISALELTAAVCDAGSYVPFEREADHLSAGLGRVAGWAVVAVGVGGGAAARLDTRDLRRLERSYRLSRRNRLPLIILENCAGIDEDANRSYSLLSDLTAELRDSEMLKICVITGKGHALGTFPLGSRQLGIDYFVAWPWASLSIVDPPTDYTEEALDAVREPDPWLAAGRALIDDVLSPEDSRDAVHWLVGLYMANRRDGGHHS
jgi:acetyl-CoA carboxylase carboxyltransferase component